MFTCNFQLKLSLGHVINGILVICVHYSHEEEELVHALAKFSPQERVLGNMLDRRLGGFQNHLGNCNENNSNVPADT